MSAEEPEPRIVQDIRVENGFAYGAIGADIHVFSGGLPLYLLANWQPEESQSPEWLRNLPSRMLSGRRAVVPFTGREAELERLRRWRDSSARLAVHWLYGPGGQGKTRLTAHFAADSAAADWKVVAAFYGPDADRPEAGSQDLRLGNATGLLVIVDYADRWALTSLTWLLKNELLHQRGIATRVLMVARTADPWPAIRGMLDAHEAESSSYHLPGLGQESGERRSMFTVARDSFAALYQIPGAEGIGPPATLGQSEFALTLAIHMAALVAVDAHVTGQRPPSGMAGLTMYLLDREQLHWARLSADGAAAIASEASSYQTPPQVMNQAVFTAALTGTVSPSVGVTLLQDLQLPEPRQVLRDHAVCYPPSAPGPATVLEPLYPDRLAEDFLALTLPGHQADYPAQAWAAATVSSVLDRHLPAAWKRRSITFLASAAQRWPHLSHRYLFPLLLRDPQLAIDAGSAALSAVAAIPSITLAVLEAIETRLPHGLHVDLDVGIAALAARLAEYRLKSRNPAARFRTLRDLATALGRAGMNRQALAALEESVDLQRRLARANLPQHEEHIASTLEDLSVILNKLERREEAVAATQEATEIRQRLAQVHPVARAGQPPTPARSAVHGTGDTAALDDSSTWWAKLALKMKGMVWEATAEIAYYRRLHARADQDAIRELRPTGSPDWHQVALSTSLTHQARALWQAGRLDEALPLALEAVDIGRRVPLAEPNGQRAAFAFSLFILSILLSELSGREEEALAAAEEAAQIYRGLAQANPAAHEMELATSLGGLGARLHEAGRQEEGFAITAEAVEIYRRLAQANPAAHEYSFAGSLVTLGINLQEAGRQEEAFPIVMEALEIWRRLVQADPMVYEPDLAVLLTSAATLLGELRRSEKALALAEEAVEIRRRLARADAATYEPDLALSLGVLGMQLLGLGRSAEALAAIAESIELNPESAAAVGTRGQVYRAQGWYEDAVADLTRAIELDPELAWAVVERGETYRLAARYEDAVADLTRAIELDPESAAAIGRRGQAYQAMDRHEDAVADLTRALELNPESAEAVGTRGEAYRDLGRHEDAVADLTRAIELGPELAWAVANRGETYRLMDCHEEALADLNRAVELDPEHAAVVATRGQVYQAMGRLEDAVADLTRAIELDPELAWAVAERGETYRLMDCHEEALADLNRAIELDPQYAWAVGTRGQVYQAMDRHEEAVTDLTRAVELDPDLAWAVAERGETYRLMGRYEDALTDLNQAIQADPDYVWALASRGAVHRALGQYENALADLTQAIELDPQYGWALRVRGHVCQEMGRPSEALSDWDQLLSLDPDDGEAHANKGIALTETGDLDRALTEFDAAIRAAPADAGVARAWAGAILWHRRDPGAAGERFAQVMGQVTGLTPFRAAAMKAIALCGLGQPGHAEKYLLKALPSRIPGDRGEPQAIYRLLRNPLLPGIERIYELAHGSHHQ